MKKASLIVILILTTMFGYSQIGKKTAAYNFLRAGKLDKAKEAIDLAIENPKTKDDPQTWMYKGDIYVAINASTDENIKKLDEDAITKAYQAYMQAKALDDKNTYILELTPKILLVSDGFFNKGVEEYNKKSYTAAAHYLMESYKLTRSNGDIDTTALYYAGMSYELDKNWEMAKSTYKELVDLSYPNAGVYTSYAEILKTEGENEKALEVVGKGREAFPDNFGLLITETNLCLETGNRDKALENLKIAIETDKENATIHFAVGTIYDVIFADTANAEPERLQAFEEAATAYKSAIALKDDYFDAFYNLGVIHYNMGAHLLQEANELPFGDPKYEKEKEKGIEYMRQALPFLLRARELNGEDFSTLYSLKQIYSRTGEMDKLKEVNDKLQEIEQ